MHTKLQKKQRHRFILCHSFLKFKSYKFYKGIKKKPKTRQKERLWTHFFCLFYEYSNHPHLLLEEDQTTSFIKETGNAVLILHLVSKVRLLKNSKFQRKVFFVLGLLKSSISSSMYPIASGVAKHFQRDNWARTTSCGVLRARGIYWNWVKNQNLRLNR